MADFADAVAAIRQHLADSWSATPVAWPNVAFDPDAPGGGFPPGGPFLRLQVQAKEAVVASFGTPGGNRHRQLGTIRAEIFVPADVGDTPALEQACAVAALFRGRRLGAVRCGAARIGEGEGGGPQRRWWRRSVEIAFQVDETG